MTRLTRDIVIKAPPEKVWKILADFPNYPAWNRSTTMVPEPNKPDLITFGVTLVRPNGKSVPWALMARVTSRQPPLLAWKMGYPGFLSVRMTCAVTPHGAGSEVSYTAEVVGLVPALFPNHFPNLFPVPMTGMLRDLKARAEVGRRSPAPKPSPRQKNRHGGPPPRRR